MAGETTTYGDISPRTALHAAAEMLSHAMPVLVLSLFGQTKEMPRNSTLTISFRRAVPFSTATTPLVEGVTPSAHKMSFEDVSATLKQYGDVVEISDVVEDTHEDPVLMAAMELTGEQAGATIEELLWGIVKAGTSVFYANGASRSAVNTAITLNKQRACTKLLKRQKAKKITKILDSSPDYEVRAVEASYVAIGHTDCESDIRNLTGFVPTSRYGTRSLLCEQEIGAVEDVRYVLSADLDPFADAGGAKGSMVSTSGTSADVYPIIVVGREAYAHVPLKGMRSVTPTVVNKKPSDSDPLAQRTKIGWKTYFAGLILNQSWMTRLEVAVTDL